MKHTDDAFHSVRKHGVCLHSHANAQNALCISQHHGICYIGGVTRFLLVVAPHERSRFTRKKTRTLVFPSNTLAFVKSGRGGNTFTSAVAPHERCRFTRRKIRTLRFAFLRDLSRASFSLPVSSSLDSCPSEPSDALLDCSHLHTAENETPGSTDVTRVYSMASGRPLPKEKHTVSATGQHPPA